MTGIRAPTLQEAVHLASHLAAIQDEQRRQRFLAEHPGLLRPEVVEGLCDQAVAELRVDLGRARKSAAAARWLGDALDDPRSRGQSLRASANVRLFDRDYRAALKDYEAALREFEHAEDPVSAAITRSSALTSLISLGEYARAKRWGAAARRIFEQSGDTLRLARLESNLGNICARQDRFEEALAHYRAAHDTLRDVGSPMDIGIVLRNIAVCLQDLHDFSASFEAYERARNYCKQNHLPLVLLEIEYNIAYLHYLRGHFTKAIRLFELGRKKCAKEQDYHHLSLCDLDQAEIFLELNLAAEADRLAERARQGFGELGMRYEEAKALTLQGLAAHRQGNMARTRALFAQGRKIFLHEGNRIWSSTLDLHEARILIGEGQHQEAGRLIDEALDIFSSCAEQSKIALCEILLARLALRRSDPDDARERCTHAEEILESLFLPGLELQLFAVAGRVEEALHHPEEALVAYRRAYITLERLRGRLPTDELRTSFFEDKLEIYESLVWLTLDRDTSRKRLEKTLTYIEKSKSRSLADLIAFKAPALAVRSAKQGQLARNLSDLREDLARTYRQIELRHATEEEAPDRDSTVEPNKKTLHDLRTRCRQKEEKLLRALREIQSIDPEFGSLREGSTVDLKTIRSHLPPETLLIEYFFARGRIFAALVGEKILEIRTLGKISDAQELHQLLRYQFSKFLLIEDYVDHFSQLMEESARTHLRGLYKVLIAPLLEHLTARHLIIVPHDFLHYVPFHALLDQERYLIDRFSISYAPSASVFHLCHSKETAAGDRPLVLGVADEKAPQIRREAETVAASLPEARFFLGEEASEDNLRRFGARASLLHLATHGYFRRDNPMFSAIQLGTSRLSLFDLYDLELEAELVVLSGCGTGLSAVRGADELVGLTRGLLHAGARSVMVTLWDVNDESTAELMRFFYRHLETDHNPTRALRHAMWQLREVHSHPYYWAPFILIGGLIET